MRRLIVPMLSLLALAALGGLLAALAIAAVTLPPGEHRFQIEHGGLARSYLVHVPPQAQLGRALPVVLNLHGGGGAALQHQRYTGMDALADREGFIVVYPNGSGRLGEKLLTWNAGPCCGYAQAQRTDDAGFVAALLDDLGQRTPVDAKRVYATGSSNGAMMAYALAEALPERIAAVAPVGGARPPLTSGEGRPVPILHIHSLDDTRAHYEGGAGPFNFQTGARIQHPPVAATVARWAARNGCSPEPRPDPPVLGRGEDARHTATRLAWAGCRDGAEVLLFRLAGPGHVWPGGNRDGLRRILGTPTKVIDANEEIWRFFSRYRLP